MTTDRLPHARPRVEWPTAPPPRHTRLRRGLRIAAAVASVLTLALTGYGWAVYRHLDTELATTDAIGTTPTRDGATDILLVGLDSRTDAHGNPLPQQVLDALDAGPDDGTLNTDTLILVRIPDDPSLRSTAVSIPRDSYVDIPGFGTHKINSAYARASLQARTQLQAQGVTGPELDQRALQAGRRSLIATVQALTGLSVDHYAELNLAGFAEITRTIGGVPVCLRNPVKDSYSGADFPAGPQTVSGPSALAFVRQRHGLPRGDLDRVVRQQAFLASLAHTMLSAGTLANPATLSSLIDVVGHYVVLDQGWDVLAFAAQVQGMTGGNIGFRTMPTGRPDFPTPGDGVAVQVNPALVRAFFTELAQPSDAPSPPASGAAPTVVDVLNATRRTGLAAGVSDLLDNNGFVPGTIGNATKPGARTTVRGADRAIAQQVAHLLGDAPVEVDPTVTAGRVEVVLGRDYQGPGTAGATSGAAGTAGAAGASGGSDPSGASGLDAGTSDGTGSSDGAGGTDPAGRAGAAGKTGSTGASAPPEITAAGVPCVN